MDSSITSPLWVETCFSNVLNEDTIGRKEMGDLGIMTASDTVTEHIFRIKYCIHLCVC